MVSIEELKKHRFQFLHFLYEKTEGDEHSHVNMWELGEELGFEKEKTNKITQYLVGESLMEYAAMGGIISITHQGVIEVENALTHPEEPTEYFPPVNIININHMENSQIQQSSSYSTQTQSIETNNINDLLGFIEILKTKLPELELRAEDKSEIEADIATLHAQLDSARPKENILKESLSSIQRILEGATGAVVAHQLIPLIPPLLSAI